MQKYSLKKCVNECSALPILSYQANWEHVMSSIIFTSTCNHTCIIDVFILSFVSTVQIEWIRRKSKTRSHKIKISSKWNIKLLVIKLFWHISITKRLHKSWVETGIMTKVKLLQSSLLWSLSSVVGVWCLFFLQ